MFDNISFYSQHTLKVIQKRFIDDDIIFPKFYQILKQYFLVHSFIHDDQNMLQGIRRWKGTTFTESNCEGEIERDGDEKEVPMQQKLGKGQ